MQKMTNQEVTSGIEKRLAVSEEADREILVLLLNNMRPFESHGCNLDYVEHVEEASRAYFQKLRWHRSIRLCAERGDPDIQFGGKSNAGAGEITLQFGAE
ncbi:MAG: hypothetical protein ACPG61_16000 [Paracoccaceae bacterium]